MSDFQPVNIEAEVAPKWLKGDKGDKGDPGKVYTPTVSREGQLSWTLDDGRIAPSPANIKGPTGERGPIGPNGKVYTPKVSEAGDISWTLDDGETPPETANIKGPKGERGEAGPAGPAGPEGVKGKVYTPKVSPEGQLSWTLDDGETPPETADIKGPKGDRGETGPKGDPGLPKTYDTTGTATDGAMTQKAVTDALEAIQVGGRNLYRGTRDFSGASWKNVAYWVKESADYNGLSVYSRDTRWSGFYQEIADVAVGETYAFSFYAKAGSPQEIAVAVTPSEPYAKVTVLPATHRLTTEWKRYASVFTVTGADGPLKAKAERTSEAGAKIYLCGLKLERGNKATDWTPAPEDIYEKIDALEARLKALEGPQA